MAYVSQRRSGIMLCYPYTERRLTDPKFGWEPPYIAQPKLNGHRARLLWTPGNEPYFVSSEQNVIPGIPHLVQEMRSKGAPNVELDGELYAHGMTLEEISSIVSRTVNLHPRYFDIEFHVFDIVIAGLPQSERTKALFKLFEVFKYKGTKFIHMVPVFAINTVEELMHLYDNLIERGYEGFVVREKSSPYMRKRSIYLMKFKPKEFDVYRIVGTVEEHDIYGVLKNRLGSIVCQGDDGTKFNVGTGYTADLREALWKIRETLPGKWLKIGYQNMTAANRVPYAARYVEILDTYTPPKNPDFVEEPETLNFDVS